MKPAQRIRLTILGCGSSPGVPRIGNDWGNCDPDNPKNRRRRPSLLVEGFTGDVKTVVVIDTGPDFREQILDAEISWADGVLYTHHHADHCHGLDDLRGFFINKNLKKVQTYADKATQQRLYEGFGYCFETPPGSYYKPILQMNTIVTGEPIIIEGEGGSLTFMPFPQHHGQIISLGFRIGNTAYSSDISKIHKDSYEALRGLDLWILDALQYAEHPTHFSLDQAVEAINEFGAKNAILTHMHTPLDYTTVMNETPDHIQPAYDGMQIWLDDIANHHPA